MEHFVIIVNGYKPLTINASVNEMSYSKSMEKFALLQRVVYNMKNNIKQHESL